MGSLFGHLFLVVEKDAQLVTHLVIQLVERVLLLVTADKGSPVVIVTKIGRCANICRILGATARD